MEFQNPVIDASNLYNAEILTKNSYYALKLFKQIRKYDREAASALVNLLFEDLEDPLAYEKFIKYCNSSTKIRSTFRQLTLLGKQYYRHINLLL